MVVARALWRLFYCPNDSEITLKGMGTNEQQQTTTKHNKTQQSVNRIYNTWHVLFVCYVNVGELETKYELIDPML